MNGKKLRQKAQRRAKQIARRITEAEIEAIRADAERRAEDIFIREANKIPRVLRWMFRCQYGHRTQSGAKRHAEMMSREEA